MLLELDKKNWTPEEREARKAAKDAALRQSCCVDEMDDTIGDCDSFRWPKGPAMNLMLK